MQSIRERCTFEPGRVAVSISCFVFVFYLSLNIRLKLIRVVAKRGSRTARVLFSSDRVTDTSSLRVPEMLYILNPSAGT